MQERQSNAPIETIVSPFPIMCSVSADDLPLPGRKQGTFVSAIALVRGVCGMSEAQNIVSIRPASCICHEQARDENGKLEWRVVDSAFRQR